MSTDPRSGIDAGGSFVPVFAGQRPPFAKGNDTAVRHGARARLKLAPRAEQIAASLREVAPIASPADDATIDLLAMVLAQVERATLVLGAIQARELERVQSGGNLDPADRDDLRRLASDARSWTNTALRYFEALGLTPLSRAKLGLDVARTEDTLAQLAAAGAEIRIRRGLGVVDGG